MKYYCIAPVCYEDLKWTSKFLDGSLDLGNEVFLKLMPDWLKNHPDWKRINEFMQWGATYHGFVLMKEYEAEALGEVTSGSPGESKRSKEDAILELIQLTNLTLWLAKSSSIGFEIALYFMMTQDGKWVLRKSMTQNPVKFDEEDRGTVLERKDFDRARQLNDNLISLKRSGPVWMSVWSLWNALTITAVWPVNYLVFWIALEALFSPLDSREVTYRLSQRLAFFISEDKVARLECSKRIRKSYGWRSKIVHGMRLSKFARSEIKVKMDEVRGYINQVLNRILTDPSLISKFDEISREDYLEELVCS